jgi:hypothetical protein
MYIARMNKLRYGDLATKDKALLAHTGLTSDEFERLCPFFEAAWQRYIRAYTFEGKPRQRESRKQRANAVFATPEDRLLFVLYYLKTNPLQEVLASAFGLRQPHASFWLKLLLPRLKEALCKAQSLPERKSEHFYRTLEGHSCVLIDGTERPVRNVRWGAPPITRPKRSITVVKKRHTIKKRADCHA